MMGASLPVCGQVSKHFLKSVKFPVIPNLHIYIFFFSNGHITSLQIAERV